MTEPKEKEIKEKLITFIRDNFVFEGEPNKIQEKLYDTTELLFQLVCNIAGFKITPYKLEDGKDDLEGGIVIHS